MANNYSLFSELIEGLTDDEKKWIWLMLSSTCPGEMEDADGFKAWREERGVREDDESDWFPSFEWKVRNEDNTLWLHSDESLDVEYLATFVQMFIKKFRPEFVFTATGADYCSKPRIGEFGGWWIAVSAKEIVYGGCHLEADKARERLTAELKAS